MTNPFAPATREQAKARIALCGPSGSGKTFTALSIAAGLGERVALVDTEHGSASKYAVPAGENPGPGMFRFDTVKPTKFDPRELVKLFAASAQASHEVLIVDSLTHYWSGPGGVLELVDQAASKARGNSFAGWKDVRPFEKALVDAFLGFPGHVIVTMRTKTEYVVEEDDRGRKAPRKVGLKPEQRDGIEYEFDLVGDLDVSNRLVMTKSRCPALSGAVVDRPGPEMAKKILDWLSVGERVADAIEYRDRALACTTFEEIRDLRAGIRTKHPTLLGAVIMDNHGDEVTLDALTFRLGNEMRAAS